MDRRKEFREALFDLGAWLLGMIPASVMGIVLVVSIYTVLIHGLGLNNYTDQIMQLSVIATLWIYTFGDNKKRVS